MLTKVLIANRGAIACRIIRTLKKMGIGSVAVYHQQDLHSRHVQEADEAYSLGEGSVANTYLNQQRLLEVAKQSGAEAIHPGYGFLSENPDFANACAEAGVFFLGPRAEHMNAFGLKHSARALAEANHVPLLPGTELLTDLNAALEAAEGIKYPVMLKSTAGGGGIGMQLCYSADELTSAWDSVKRLSANNFANDGVFLEKFVEKARHIEVQVFGDGNGKVITLGERDCSLQRRNQKVLEETPAPGLSNEQRAQLQATAERLTAAVSYQSAGTVEFIFDASTGEFYFLEVNTRLQVEHGVTEEVYGVDLVEWMVRLPGVQAGKDSLPLDAAFESKGHSIQARVYAEDPALDFQPSAGLLSRVEWPEQASNGRLRIDTWVESGTTIPALFDPMVAKVIVTADNREQAITGLSDALAGSQLYGIETNRAYLLDILADQRVAKGDVYTQLLKTLSHQPNTIQVIAAGTQTTVQDLPARVGYWDIGVPPSGPFDSYSFELGNRLLGNKAEEAGLEITLKGPVLKFNSATRVLLAGATTNAKLTRANGEVNSVEFWQAIEVQHGDVLDTGSVSGAGARAYLLIDGGLQVPDYLGSKSTFTLGQFGGHNGRSLLPGDVLHVLASKPATNIADSNALLPDISNEWQLRVIYGPHGAPEFFTEADIDTLFETAYEIHYNSSRTGVRLIGPKPEWARTDGGEAGLHPSNIHDNAYAIGTIDFTGDMPVVLGPDGPSLGGFVCPATVITADLWKLGQLKAGDKVRFVPVSQQTAVELFEQQASNLKALTSNADVAVEEVRPASPIIAEISTDDHPTGVVYRPSGDRYLLVEYGPLQLDIRLRFRVHALMQFLQSQHIDGLQELTPGIRSLQLHYDSTVLPQAKLLELLQAAEDQLGDLEGAEVPSRIVHLPLSWDDEVCRLAAEKYMQSVRADAPWCPDNIEFIRRINGLDSIQDVKDIVFNASYLVMGLGDVYLGAPVATPVDPRHRLVTTKYNPARTWTAENSVGIGGAYMCIYGMEGPGGYQFVGRTLQQWNRYKQTKEFTQPWLLRFFDQVRFYEVSHDELTEIRQQFPHGQYPIKIEETRFNLAEYEAFLAEQASGINEFQVERQKAFQEELEDWKRTGRFNYDSEPADTEQEEERVLEDGEFTVESHVAGNVWQCLVKPGDKVDANQPLLILESMKMEIEVASHQAGTVVEVVKQAGQGVAPGSLLVVLKED
ncbi:urea carboxylase [Oceanobacter kriegii]|uniref:urea carboxylase n=1 Tax=Oceanobacter kriegii TaxID=64972 RepID=UPI0004082DE1|nr:urea carboxylase [Oceanobacter kriegii]